MKINTDRIAKLLDSATAEGRVAGLQLRVPELITKGITVGVGCLGYTRRRLLFVRGRGGRVQAGKADQACRDLRPLATDG